MRRFHVRWLLPLTMIAALIGCAGTQQQQTPTVDTAAITASIDSLNKGWQAAVAARDTDAVVAFYAADGRLMPAGMPRAEGHDAIRAAWAGFLQTPGLELTITESQPMISEAGDMVVDVGAYSMKMNDAKGKPVVDVGKYVTVFKKTDSGWKIVVDTFNSDQTPPGM